MRRLTLVPAIPLALAAVLALLALIAPLAAQAQFSTRITVNGHAITDYEYDQRLKFMTLLRAPGDVVAATEEALIEDRLRMTAASEQGITLTDEQIIGGMEEFASRANLSADEFVTEMEKAGVAGETFRDFVRAGVIWREVVRARFSPRIRISDAEIDRALSLNSNRGLAPRVLFSELVIPAPPSQAEAAMELAQRLSATIRSEAAFAAAAKTYSTGPSAADGGRLEWSSAANLAPAAQFGLQGLTPGQISPPVPAGPAIALYFLRDIRPAAPVAPEGPHVDYAEYLVPADANATAELARIRGKVDKCNDLYAINLGQPEERLQFASAPVANLPADVRREIEGLDAGESSTALTRGGSRVFLMLCRRQAGGATDLPSRDAMRIQLTNEALSGYADGYMADLKANAIIRYR